MHIRFFTYTTVYRHFSREVHNKTPIAFLLATGVYFIFYPSHEFGQLAQTLQYVVLSF